MICKISLVSISVVSVSAAFAFTFERDNVLAVAGTGIDMKFLTRD